MRPLRNLVKELNKHIDLQNEKYQALTESASAKSEKLARTELKLEHEGKELVHLLKNVEEMVR